MSLQGALEREAYSLLTGLLKSNEAAPGPLNGIVTLGSGAGRADEHATTKRPLGVLGAAVGGGLDQGNHYPDRACEITLQVLHSDTRGDDYAAAALYPIVEAAAAALQDKVLALGSGVITSATRIESADVVYDKDTEQVVGVVTASVIVPGYQFGTL